MEAGLEQPAHAQRQVRPKAVWVAEIAERDAMGDDLIWISGAHDLVLAWACSAAALLLSSLYDFTWSYPPLALVGVIALARLRTD